MRGGARERQGSGRREIQSLPFFTCYRILYLRIVQLLTRKNVNTQGNIEGGVHRGDLFVDDGSIYVMSITTEWQNAPKGDEGNWIKIRIN